ncbi:hypothetical protein BCD64_06890 [Nostoc sp. MBR 210]|uniref:Glycine zipper 2TM domain-containing protein n=1 Tax=Nostoc spongiaeforme FACHB-130 TaxID=1357510 RepID=A0ABR8FNF8_9NOSO|nr:hypothetical protein [Nostoc spongiaeforme]MBD2593011.1 hypothetical protein [Nostoc spongiaeforme FACHB-130]OCQ97817.1 hypothetical protein BCD64_06890 [Nostoc sp. MBR 210]
MQNILKRAFLPGLMAVSLTSVSLIPTQSASADDRVIHNAAIGAGASAITGALTGCGSVLNNAITGAGAGAAVNGANGLRTRRARARNGRRIVQDVGVGAVAGVATGAITGGCRTTWKNGVNGAAAGAAVHFLDPRNRKRR